MTFQEHQPFGNRQVLNVLAVLSGIGVTAAMLVGASNETRSIGSLHCTGITQESVEPGTPVDQFVQDIAERFDVNSDDYRTIFLRDNRGTDSVFAEDYNQNLVIASSVVNVAESCS